MYSARSKELYLAFVYCDSEGTRDNFVPMEDGEEAIEIDRL